MNQVDESTATLLRSQKIRNAWLVEEGGNCFPLSLRNEKLKKKKYLGGLWYWFVFSCSVLWRSQIKKQFLQSCLTDQRKDVKNQNMHQFNWRDPKIPILSNVWIIIYWWALHKCFGVFLADWEKGKKWDS